MRIRVLSVKLPFFFLLLLAASSLQAQDTLPRFSVRNVGNNRVIVSWVNPFPNVAQITIQRGFDSIGPFKTILSVADPRSVENGYSDTKAPNDHMWYRLFYAMEGGTFYFTKSKRPDTGHVQVPPAQRPVAAPPGDVLYKYKDSIFVRNRDTFVVVNRDTLRVKNNDTLTRPRPTVVVRKPEWIPSVKVFTNNEGYVQVRLPDAGQKDYSVKFYQQDSTFLFEIKGIKEKLLLLDKANFYRSGWFYFELYDDEKLVERNKFYLRP